MRLAMAAGELVKPLVELITTRVKQSKVIHTDDTRVPVQDRTIKGKCKSGRIWTYIGDESNPYIASTTHPTAPAPDHNDSWPTTKVLSQADAYGGYDGTYHRGEVIEVACWAHAHLNFFDAKETDGRREAQMLEMVRQLYGGSGTGPNRWMLMYAANCANSRAFRSYSRSGDGSTSNCHWFCPEARWPRRCNTRSTSGTRSRDTSNGAFEH